MLHRAFLENRGVQNRWTPLFEACSSGNIVLVKRLLENHANPNIRNRNGETPLFHISSSESETTLQIIQLLLQHNADINAVDYRGWTPLFVACDSGNIVTIKCLLENHANPNIRNRNGETPLFHISSSESETTLQIIQLLLQHNADIDAVHQKGLTPLFRACGCGNIELVKCLLENHANPNIRYRNGQTPLHHISSSESETTLQIIQLLLQHNADIEAVDEEGRTPLFVACDSGNIVTIKCLLENHANPNIRNRNGQTPLHHISSSESETTLQIIQLLLKHNADIEAGHENGWTPLFQACDSGNIVTIKCLLENHANLNAVHHRGETALHFLPYRESETILQIIQLLLKQNADIEAVDENGWTPLIRACRSGNIKAVQCLLESHANPNATDRNGQSALHLIHSNRMLPGTIPQMILLLLKHNADIEAVDEEGRTPLFEACIYGSDEAVKCFLRYGANVNILDKRNRSPLQCAVDRFLTFSVNSNFYAIVQMLVLQIIKLKTARLNVNACEFITINGVKYSVMDELKFNTLSDDIIDTLDIMCEEEIERMKMESIGINDMFFYDLLTQHIHLLGILMENEKIQEILKPSIYDEKFPLYIGIIRFRLRDAQIRYRRYKLKKSAREYFSSHINRKLSHECIEEVLDYLTVVDLKMFIRIFE